MSSGQSNASGWSKLNASPLLDRAVAEVDVVRVELDQGEVLLAGELGQPLGHGGLARRRAAGHADQERPRRQLTHEAATIAADDALRRVRCTRLRCRAALAARSRFAASPARASCRTSAPLVAGADARTAGRPMTDVPEGQVERRRRAAPASGRRLRFTGRFDAQHRARRHRRRRRLPDPARDLRRRRRLGRPRRAGHDHGRSRTTTATSGGRVDGRRPSAPTTTVGRVHGRDRRRRQRQRHRRLGGADDDGARSRRLHAGRGRPTPPAGSIDSVGRLLRARRRRSPGDRRVASPAIWAACESSRCPPSPRSPAATSATPRCS